MKISIVTPSFNQGRFIRDTLDSVARQDHKNVEHIVMDGGSTDDTLDVLKTFSSVVWVSEKDEGQTDAILKGFARSTGEVCSWLNSDDMLAPNVLGEVSRYFETHPECMILYGDITFIDSSGKHLFSRTGPVISHDQLIRFPDIVRQPSTFWRRSVLDAVGGLDRSLHIVMDFDFFLRASRRYTFHHIPTVLSYYRTYPENKTNSMLGRQAREIYRVYRKNGIPITPGRLKYLLVKFIDAAGIGGPLRSLYRPFKKSESFVEQDHPVR